MRSIKYDTLAEWVTTLAAVLRAGGRPPRPVGCRPVPWWSLVALMLSAAAGAPLLATERVPVKSLLEMRQDRVVVQKWDLSCGAAALATLLTYQHGDPVSERAITRALIQRQEYLVNPSLVRVQEGFSLLDLKRYVDKRGYKGIGYARLMLQDLIKHAPIIVPVNLHGYNHFVVFRGVYGDRVLIADPAWGNHTLQVERFENAWIDFPQLDRVGFVVVRRDGTQPSNRLAPRASEFVMLR
jgi:predicted double-glycine peptidase